MSFPKVTVLFSNGNLLQNVQAADGVAGLLATSNTVANNYKVYQVFNLKDAETQGLTAAAEPYAYKHIKEFYDQVGANQELWLMIFPPTVLMENMLDFTNELSAKKLIKQAQGKIRLLGVTHKGPTAKGADFLEPEVVSALLAAKTFAVGCLGLLMPLRILVEGLIGTETSTTVFTPTTAANGFAGVVLGNTMDNTAGNYNYHSAVGLVLGRAAKYPAHIKIGKVANGPVNASAIRIGTKPLNERADLEALHGAGYISFMTHPQKAGFYLGVDRMASTDDYRLLVYGRIVDKAAVIAAAVLIEQLEGEVDVEASGKIQEADCKHIEGRIEQQIKLLMADQVSQDGIMAYINPDQNIINTNKLLAKIRIRPKGYTSFIEVDLGLTTTGI